jgi:DNA-3-methyladenine glycosylase
VSLASIDVGLRFPREFFEHPVPDVARALLGACLISTVDGMACAGAIVETEAYGGAEDPASHASVRSGVTARNRAMFGEAGRAYVYRSYGVHWCMNVVTGPVGRGEAVLLRGIVPVQGEDSMSARRAGRRPIGAGPGRLAQALGITRGLYGHDLTVDPLILVPGWSVPDRSVECSGRVGISTAANWPLRFYVAGSSGVSRPAVRNLEEQDSA